MENGGKRAAAVWHRRAGKDDIFLHWAAVAAHQRAGTYWHMLPKYKQARKAIWDAINPHTGIRRIDEAFPPELREKTREDEMFIKFHCGSTWQVVGSDTYNSVVGSPPLGVTFSEYSLAKPAAWDYIRPILAENGGWAAFIFTPRGENHGHELFEMARKNPEWFSQVLTVADTGAIKQAVIDEERLSGMAEEMIQQEYYCSFTASLVGSYYGRMIEELLAKGRMTSVPYDPALPVYTYWDLGIGDSTAIWFCQKTGNELRFIDYYENQGYGLPHYVEVLNKRGYKYGHDGVPHDAKVRELGTGRTRVETLIGLGRDPKLVPMHKIEDGINGVRQVLPICWFDAEKCQKGLKALKHYQKEWDEDKRCFKDAPLHDWTSHAADSFRYACMAYREEHKPADKPKDKTIQEMTLNDLWKSQRKRVERI
jgi:phage terminase large subunit